MTADELIDAVSAFRRATRRAIDRPSKLLQLSNAQIELVRVVRRRPGVSVAEAAAELRLAPNTVSTLVRQLTDEGVLVRRPDDADRRVAHLDLPPRLRREVEVWRDRRADAIDTALAALTASDRRTLEAAVPVLARLAEEVAS